MEATLAPAPVLRVSEKLDRFLERNFVFRSTVDKPFTDLVFSRTNFRILRVRLWMSRHPLVEVPTEKLFEVFRKQNRGPRQSLQVHLGDDLKAYTYYKGLEQVILVGAWEEGTFHCVETRAIW